eukprot:Platyproteum_vivax@DN5035_c0_g1_i2.p1
MGKAEYPVVLNVYHVPNMVWINNLLYVCRQNCGLFHAGVVVHGIEFFFQALDILPHKDELNVTNMKVLTPFGICGIEPGTWMPTKSLFKESVFLGFTKLSFRKVLDLLSEIGPKWSGDSYQVLEHNCVHFCEDLSVMLTSRKPPCWINDMSRWLLGRHKKGGAPRHTVKNLYKTNVADLLLLNCVTEPTTASSRKSSIEVSIFEVPVKRRRRHLF